MKKNGFSTIRRYLGKTQSQMAQLLSVSSKAIRYGMARGPGLDAQGV